MIITIVVLLLITLIMLIILMIIIILRILIILMILIILDTLNFLIWKLQNHPHPHIPFWSKENHPIYSGRTNMYRHNSGN